MYRLGKGQLYITIESQLKMEVIKVIFDIYIYLDH